MSGTAFSKKPSKKRCHLKDQRQAQTQTMVSKHMQYDVYQAEVQPFESAEQAWFWFIDAYQAKHEGARIKAGLSLVPRPCEPLDILKIVDRLYRNRRLIWDHLLVLRHYGQRKMPPDDTRAKEIKAATLWTEALEKLEDVLIAKQIVERPFDPIPHSKKQTYQYARRDVEECI